MAIMLLVFLLHLVNSFEGLSGAEDETLCTSNACYTLHMENLIFNKAHLECTNNGGYLMTLRDRQEEDALLSLLSLIQRQEKDGLRIWIGLKLDREDCVHSGKSLKGFKWVSGEEESHYSNWEREPPSTCTQNRCVKVNYTFSGNNQLKWIDGPCKNPAPYVCKFYFKSMCTPLTLLGRGQIHYTAPFSKNPQKGEMKLFPHGTYANIICSDQQSHYSVCNTSGWTNQGPFCTIVKQNCKINNGGCQHLCQQTTDTDVQCLCKDGYDLEEDGLSCRRTHLCGPDTCEHQCVIKESGFSCKCPEGFKLHQNQRNCYDIDECKSKACGDHLCLNTHGSYKCVCNEGYKMVDGRCDNVDECAQLRCDHICLNDSGSYSCSCNEGFALSNDGYSCVDIDECASSGCLPEFMCVNTEGSFLCDPVTHFNIDPTNYTPTLTSSSDDPAKEETQENFTESLTRTTVELQHQSPHTDAPLPDVVNHTHRDQQTNTSLVTTFAKTANYRVIICVLGSVIPLVVLVAVTLFIAIFRCSRSKKEVKKSTTTDGYCWVSSGLDPRLEKLYESILTDDP
ncbi:complement component C1q receptor [Mugil cephalus]|uniref:complement component C1q receptor n=1 Tax=Mugil cephalus TaxID=48193 RepID=UPI001FB59144|nr:complement component C1q receptor [Mugil cephalus]